MTQYCEGIATGAQSCPADAAHVGYPEGGALAGVWVDNSEATPTNAIDYNIGAEAVKAAGHFGNTTAESNRSVQYVVVSPTGTFPGGFNTPNGGFCAWHDYTGDTTLNGGAVPSPYGQLAFTNMPYVTDMGIHCGANYVNSGSAGALDGVTIVEGHEYAETITDQNPMGGWSDSGGWETGDKCAWKKGVPGGAANVDFSTGSFAMQGTWANDANNGQGGCEISHPIVK
jgi:serine protease